MWFFFALLTMLFWGGADLFYKMGARPTERCTHLKTTIMVGAVMGIHATFYWIINAGEVSFTFGDIIRYFPVSFFYITSMTVGYFGLRYLEVSISSPVQNSSGALVSLLCCVFFIQSVSGAQILGIAMICVGIIILGIIEKQNDDRARALAGEKVDPRYRTGILAITFPVIYCLLDAAGTFLDAIYLGEAESAARFVWLGKLLDGFEVMEEDTALLAYEYTFLIAAVLCWLFMRFVKKEKLVLSREPVRAGAAVLETAGQFFYVYAMSGRAVAAAPMVASYSIVSVLLSRVFLKEKLENRQYAMVLLVIIGIAILGFFDV